MYCRLCLVRISDWMIESGKVLIIRHDPCLLRSDDAYHKACLIDFKLKYGRDFLPEPKV